MEEKESVKLEGYDIDSQVRNHTAEQFALSYCVMYFQSEGIGFSNGMRYMRELSQGRTEEDYPLFFNDYPEGVGTDHENMDIINECVKACIKEYLFDYKLFWDVVNRGMRRAHEKIRTRVLPTN